MNSFLTVLWRKDCGRFSSSLVPTRRCGEVNVRLMSQSRHAGVCCLLSAYLHVTGGSGLWWRGREVSLHDLIETTVPYILGQLGGEENGKDSRRSEKQAEQHSHAFEFYIPAAASGIKSQLLLCFHCSFIISNMSLEMEIVRGVDCCLTKAIYSLGRRVLFAQNDSPRVLRCLVCPAPWTGCGRCGPPSLGGCQSTRCRSGCPNWWKATWGLLIEVNRCDW